MLTDAAVAITAAEAGAAVARRLYRQPLARYAKSSTDFATDADYASEDAIRLALGEARPDDAVVGEERGHSPGSRPERRWLVDPLCGTQNYAAGTPLASVNVALLTSTGVRAAASADLISGEIFWTDGVTAWLRQDDRDSRLCPSSSSKLVDVNCDGDGNLLGPALVSDAVFRGRYGVRVISTTLALAWVAAGRRAGYITVGDNVATSVHFAAGIALCRSAGCVVTDLHGGPLGAGRGLIAAADVATHDQLRRSVARHHG
jgi:myo-inositol-1(or 4)-monophosphatase